MDRDPEPWWLLCEALVMLLSVYRLTMSTDELTKIKRVLKYLVDRERERGNQSTGTTRDYRDTSPPVVTSTVTPDRTYTISERTADESKRVNLSKSRRSRTRSPSPSRLVPVQRGGGGGGKKVADDDILVYCIFCKRKTATNRMVLKTSKNNRTYRSGTCDICHKSKSQFV